MKRFTNLNLDYVCWTLAIPKMKSNYHTEKKICLESKLNFVFYTCLSHFTLGLTILADVRKITKILEKVLICNLCLSTNL